MTDSVFSIEYSDRLVQKLLTDLQQRLGDLTIPMQEIGEVGLAQADLRFELQVNPSGVPWAPLSSATLSQKRAQGKILSILQRTGMMRSKLNYQATSTSVAIGINDVKAKKHQLGIGVPKREILGINSEFELEIVTILQEHLI